MSIVEITDDLDLRKIAISGQCFRMTSNDEGIFRVIAGDKALFIRPLGAGRFEVSCTDAEWRDFWSPYFDLGRNYVEIRARSKGKSDFIDEAIGYGEGLRILAQDPWEMLVTFIISQRKNMPAIANAVESISHAFGNPIPIEEGSSLARFVEENDCMEFAREMHAFPTPAQLASVKEEDLRACSLGYRAPYVLQAARAVAAGDVDPEALRHLDDGALFERLQDFHGVGAKVANCVCLFGYGRTSQVPVDVWIARAIEEECDGLDPFSQYGADAGIMQQYVFFYMTDRKRNSR